MRSLVECEIDRQGRGKRSDLEREYGTGVVPLGRALRIYRGNGRSIISCRTCRLVASFERLV